jgi:hypothetical protein
LTLKHYRADVILNKGLSSGCFSSIFACVPQVKLYLEGEPFRVSIPKGKAHLPQDRIEAAALFLLPG